MNPSSGPRLSRHTLGFPEGTLVPDQVLAITARYVREPWRPYYGWRARVGAGGPGG